MFITIDSAEIATGKPVKTEVATKIKDNFDDHEERISDLEGGSAIIYPPLVMRVSGFYDFEVHTNVLKTVCNFNLTITGVRIYVDTCGISGATEIDIKVSSAGGPYTSIFTSLPSVPYTDGDDGVSVNAVLDPDEVDLNSGDLIRLDLTEAQEDGKTFMVRIDYERN